MVADHLSRLENSEVTDKEKAIVAEFSDEMLFVVRERSWFADMANIIWGETIYPCVASPLEGSATDARLSFRLKAQAMATALL